MMKFNILKNSLKTYRLKDYLKKNSIKIKSMVYWNWTLVCS